MRYTQRLNAFKPHTTWEVGKNGLAWLDDKGGKGDIPWGKIKSVRLRYEPSRAETRRVGLLIHTPHPYSITNINYKGPLNFKLQKNEFRNFVLAFHAGFPKDTETVFYKGSTRAAYVGNLLITLLVLAFLFFLAPLLSLTGVPSLGSILRITIIILLIPILINLLVKNKPDTYRPDHIPLDMLE